MKAVNLLPGATSGAARSRRSGNAGSSGPGGVPIPTLAIAGGLLLALVAMVLHVSASNGIKEREAQLARVTVEADAAEQRAAQLKPYGDFAQMAAQRVSTVRSLAASRFDWEQVMRDLSRAIPADVTLAAMSGTVMPGSAAASVGGAGGGPGAGSLRGTLPAPAVELSGCTVNQDAVARLMSRLRNVQGATRVSLARSDKDRGSGAAATGTGGPCGTGARPSFDLVVFFENDRPAVSQAAPSTPVAGAGAPTVPASATPTPTPTATPTATPTP